VVEWERTAKMLYVDNKIYFQGRFGDLVSCVIYSELPSTQLSPRFLNLYKPIMIQIRRKHSK